MRVISIAMAQNPAYALAESKRRDFEAAVHGDSRRLFAIALSILRDAAEAEDAVQETMVRAWKSWDDLRDAGRRSAWLSRICVNHCLRRRQRGLRGWLLLGDDAPEPVAKDDPVLDARDPDLDRACRRLTAHQRAVVTLHYHHGYSLDECAGVMGCRPGTVRSHLNRALTTLRQELGS